MADLECPNYRDIHGHPTGRCWLKVKGRSVKCVRYHKQKGWVRCIHWLGPEEGGRQLKRSASTI